MHFGKFTVGDDAQTKLLNNGDFRVGGPNGAMIYYKDLNIKMGDEQIIEFKAKGDMNKGSVTLHIYGDYTLNGDKDSLTDFDKDGVTHHLRPSAQGTDADGYTTYTVDIGSIKGLKYDVIKGLRLNLYGDGERTIDIKSMDSVAPSQEELELNQAFEATGLNLTGAHFTKFRAVNGPITELLSSGDFKFEGPNGVYIQKTDMAVKLGEDQIIELKAKVTMESSARIDLYLYGEKSDGTTTQFGEKWILEKYGDVDADGYQTYRVDLDAKGVHFKEINGLRIDLIGNATNKSLEIKSLKSVVPETFALQVAVVNSVGTVVEDAFIPTVKSNGSKAQFTVSGGTSSTYDTANVGVNYTMKVTGFTKLTKPVVQEYVNGSWVRYDLSTDTALGCDGYAVERAADGTYTYSFVFNKQAADRTFAVSAN